MSTRSTPDTHAATRSAPSDDAPVESAPAGAATTGVVGRRWRASVTQSGAIEPWDGSPTLDWHVAADDRWHSPREESSVRQRRIDGTPVLETRLRIPTGDAIHRTWSVADGGGMTVVEVENDSTLPIAVAFTRGDLRTARPPTVMPIEGIALPAGSIVLPVGHHSSVMVALAHDGSGAGPLPAVVPPTLQVARAWSAMCDRAGRFVLPDEAVLAEIASVRCELALTGPEHPEDDTIGFLLGAGQLVRMGEPADPWMPDVAHAVEIAVKHARRRGDWLLAAALDAAAVVFASAGDERAAGDLAAVRTRITTDDHLPEEPPTGIRHVAWMERRLADPSGRLLAAGVPAAWLGATVEAYGLPVGASAQVSFALRWHGARPAVLWEVTGGSVELTAPVVAPDWRTTEPVGEALWPAPAVPDGALLASPPPDDDPQDQRDGGPRAAAPPAHGSPAAAPPPPGTTPTPPLPEEGVSFN